MSGLSGDRSSFRSTWRSQIAVVRVDDRAVNWMAFSPLVVIVGWVVLQSFGILAGLGGSPSALAGPAVALWVFDTVAALIDRRGLRAQHLVPLPSVLWCFAGPFAYLPLRKRALDRLRQFDSWQPLAIHAACFVLVALICAGIVAVAG